MDQGVQSPPRAGWQGHRPRRRAPDRAARRWGAGAGAPLGLRRGGGEADETMPASPWLDVPGWGPERPRTRRATRLRLVSVWRQGWGRRVGARRRPEPWPEGRWVPAPWPTVPPLAGAPSASGMVLPAAAGGKGHEPRGASGHKRLHAHHLRKTAFSKTGGAWPAQPGPRG